MRKLSIRHVGIAHLEALLEPIESLGFVPGFEIQIRNVTRGYIGLAEPRCQCRPREPRGTAVSSDEIVSRTAAQAAGLGVHGHYIFRRCI